VEDPLMRTRWHLAQKKLRRARWPCTRRSILPPQRGQTLRRYTSRFWRSEKMRRSSRKRKENVRASATMALSFVSEMLRTLANGLTRVLKSTSFLMMLPTPAKMA
jgi:hypothetical protein